MLNEQQLLFVTSRLEEEGLKHTGVKEELLDHICCSIETKMKAGTTFSVAISKTFDAFADNEFQEIESNALSLDRYKWINRKTLLGGFLLLLLFSVAYWWFNQVDNTPSILPVAANQNLSSYDVEGMIPIFKLKRTAQGLDFSIPHGTPIVATAPGKIVSVGKNKEEGITILIDHGQAIQTLYADLYVSKVEAGQYVARGEIIGLSGYSLLGDESILHYEVLCDNKQLDPSRFFKLKRNFTP